MFLVGMIIFAIALLVMAQGGFFALPSCICGVGCSVVGAVVWFRATRRRDRVSLVPVMYAGLALAYGISALVAGPSLTTLASVGAWAACASVACIAAAQTQEQRATTLHALGWFGVVTSVAGVLTAANLIHLAGGMEQSRLQFTFQYANAAAAWYGSMALLCFLSPHVRLRAFAALPMAALLQTQSAGAILVFVGVAAVLLVRSIRAAQWNRLLNALLQAALAVVAFVCVTFAGTVGALVVLAIMLFACFVLSKNEETISQHVEPRRGSFVLLAVLMVCLVAGALLLNDRATSAFASWIERTYQMRDGIRLWASSPLLGVGPNNWQYLYQYVQSAPYYTTVIHSSVVQLLVDAGLVGFACFAAACVVGLRNKRGALGRNGEADSVDNILGAESSDERVTDNSHAWEGAELFATIFLLAHACVEFDLQFSALAFLLAFLLSKGSQAKSAVAGSSSTGLSGLVAAIACAVALLPACASGLLCASTTAALTSANAAEDYAACASLFEKNPLAMRDVNAQQEYAQTLYAQKSYQKVIDMYAALPAPSDRTVYYATLSYYALNQQTEATTAMIDRLESQPYNTDFYASAQQLATAYGTDPELTARFNAAMDVVARNAGQFQTAY